MRVRNERLHSIGEVIVRVRHLVHHSPSPLRRLFRRE